MPASDPIRHAFRAANLGEALASFRAQRPHVHCITNNVAQAFTANVLLAAGAVPSMTIAREEIAAFVTMADALLVNLGTLDGERREAMAIAVDAARAQRKPWVLDPVFVQASPSRLALAKGLLDAKPDLVRANESEAKALFGDTAPPTGTVLAITGKRDRIVGEGRTITLSLGHPFMDRVTAMGCALSALIAGFASAVPDGTIAASTALALFGLAGERAGKAASGPGSFVPLFLDHLATLTPHDLSQNSQLEMEDAS